MTDTITTEELEAIEIDWTQGVSENFERVKAALLSALEAANKRAEEAEARRKCYECGSEMTACARCNPELPTAELAALRARADEAEALAERLKREAQQHAQEARTANATIAEIYQAVTGGAGEPGNWHGAEPIKAELTRLREEIEQYREAARGQLVVVNTASSRIKELEAVVVRLREALEPFAKIKPSTAWAEDGSEAEPYHVFLACGDYFDFTGADLAAARRVLEGGKADG